MAAALAGWVEAGDVVGLTGDLGAGQTTFTQGLVRALGVSEPVTSPTFTIASHYHGVRLGSDQTQALVVNHLDVYRLGSLDEAEALGLDEMLDGDALTLIEWGEMIEPLLPCTRLIVKLELVPFDEPPVAPSADVQHVPDEVSANRRVVEVATEGHGAARRERLADALIEAVGHIDVERDRDDRC